MLPIVLFPALGILVSASIRCFTAFQSSVWTSNNWLVSATLFIWIDICAIDQLILTQIHFLQFECRVRMQHVWCTWKMRCSCLLADWLLHWPYSFVICTNESHWKWFQSLDAVKESEFSHTNTCANISSLRNWFEINSSTRFCLLWFQIEFWFDRCDHVCVNVDFKHCSCSNDDPREWIIAMTPFILFSHFQTFLFNQWTIFQIMQAVLEELESVSSIV